MVFEWFDQEASSGSLIFDASLSIATSFHLLRQSYSPFVPKICYRVMAKHSYEQSILFRRLAPPEPAPRLSRSYSSPPRLPFGRQHPHGSNVCLYSAVATITRDIFFSRISFFIAALGARAEQLDASMCR